MIANPEYAAAEFEFRNGAIVRRTPEEIVASMIDRVAHPEAIKELIKIVDQVPQLEIPVTHRFYTEKCEYWREITMPAGMTGVGHIHRQKHLNLVLSGHALVTWDGQAHEVKAPAIFWSEPGAQKAFQVFADFRLVTIHPNPDNITDIQEIEKLVFQLPEENLESGLSVNDFRMQRKQLT